MPRPIRTLVLSVSIGAGHRRAAQALCAALARARPGSAHREVDALDHLGLGAGRLAKDLYMGALREAPDLWGAVYQGRGAVELLRPLSELADDARVGSLDRLVRSYRPDLVLAMHPLACGLAAALGRGDAVDGPLAAVLTDLDAHPAWVARGLHLYLAPTEAVARELAAGGLGGARALATGIPLRQGFETVGRLAAPELRAELGLDPGRLTLLLLGGGLGLGPLLEAAEALGRLPGPLQLVLVCGDNADLAAEARRLSRRTRAPLHVLGLVEEIWRVMAAADLAVGKPGGLTCAELLACGVPLVALAPIPGQERANCEALVGAGAALDAPTPGQALVAVRGLLADPARLQRMAQAARAMGRPVAARRAAQAALGLVDRWPAEELRQAQRRPATDPLTDAGELASSAVKAVGEGLDTLGQELGDLLLGRPRGKGR